MREILFRGKREDNSQWVIGFLSKTRGLDNKLHICIDYEEKGLMCSSIVIPKTVGQYTGLTDKNGTKIFEGDIIRYADNDEYNYYLDSLKHPEEYENLNFNNIWTIDEIVYGIKVGYPAFDLNSHNFDCNGLSILNESRQYHYEVISNIHDNPELLKEFKE